MLWLPRGFGRGHRAGRSTTASPWPRWGNAPPQGFLAGWYPPCLSSTPFPTSGTAAPCRAPPAAPCCHPRQGESSRCLAAACPCPRLPQAHPGPVGAGRSGCPGLSRARQSCVPAVCCHLLPLAGRQEPVWARARSQPCRRGGRGSPDPRGDPPGCARPWLEEDACGGAEDGTNGYCRAGGSRAVPAVGADTPPALAQRVPSMASVPARLHKPSCAPSTSPLACRRGARAHTPAESRPPPWLLPVTPHCGAILGHRHSHPGARGPLGPACGSCKARVRARPCKGGWELQPTGPPPPRKQPKGVWTGRYRPPHGQGGIRAGQGLMPATGEIMPWV